MARERALRRAEREREQAARAREREQQQARAARRSARLARIRRLLPQRRRQPDSALARRRRSRNLVVLAGVIVVQLVGAVVFESLTASLVLLGLTVIALPAVLTVAFDRRR